MHTPTPGLPEFEYVRPESLVAASTFLAQHAENAMPFMGGTDVFVRLRDRAWTADYLVDVKKLDGMNEIKFDPKQGLGIGAAVNMNRVISSPEVQANYPLLAEAARTVASYQLRTRATIVGNICNASPAGDTTGACIVLGGVLGVHGVDGNRQEPLSTFFKGPGKTVLNPGDIATGIHFPIPPAGWKGRYVKLGRNRIGDLALVGVAVLGYPDRETRSGYRFRLSLASVAPVPLVPEEAQNILADKPITEASIAEAAEVAMQSCRPIDDVRSCSRYRRLMIRNLTRKAVSDVWAALGG